MLLLLQSQDGSMDHWHHTDLRCPIEPHVSIQNQWVGRAVCADRDLGYLFNCVPAAHALRIKARVRVEELPVLVLLPLHLHALGDHRLPHGTKHFLERRR